MPVSLGAKVNGLGSRSTQNCAPREDLKKGPYMYANFTLYTLRRVYKNMRVPLCDKCPVHDVCNECRQVRVHIAGAWCSRVVPRRRSVCGIIGQVIWIRNGRQVATLHLFAAKLVAHWQCNGTGASISLSESGPLESHLHFTLLPLTCIGAI